MNLHDKKLKNGVKYNNKDYVPHETNEEDQWALNKIEEEMLNGRSN